MCLDPNCKLRDFGPAWSAERVLAARADEPCRPASPRFLRNYFALTGIRVPTLEEACHLGEGQNVEFKRGLSEDEGKTSSVEDEWLKSIAAFANTNDDVIFLRVPPATFPHPRPG